MANGAGIAIQIDHVSKDYGSKRAVHELTLEIPEGELFACLGPNGAGKTTTIKMITGLLRPTIGHVHVAGFDMSSPSIDARRSISFVPDQPYLYDKLTGRDFMQFTADIYGISPEQAAEYGEELIETFEMTHYVDDLAETYSHGMRQRLVFAAALLHRPRVLIVDEPMVGLDPRSTRIVKDLLRRITNEGTTVFMSTHTLNIAEELADRIGIINHGRLVRLGTLEELRYAGADGLSLEEFFLQVTAEAEE
ncbi:ABC transporter ATP-binding protein [Planctomycetes bacterium Pan216]